MRILNTLYVADHRAKLNVRHHAVEVRSGRALVARYPMAGLEAIVLTGRAELTNEAIGRCVREGIRISALSGSGRLRFAVGGPTRGNVLLRSAQHRASVDRDVGLGIARWFVAGKLQNQRRNLLRWGWDAPDVRARALFERQRSIVEERLASLSRAVTGDQIRGMEGDATRRYFKGLGAHVERVAAPLVFVDRNRRPPRDPVNSLLSFLYGLLTTEVLGALEAVGLDPQVGFLHQLRPGRPALALDMIEEFRPIAERFAAGVLGRKQIRPSMFAAAPSGACAMTDEGRRSLIPLWEEHRSEVVLHPLLKQHVARSYLPTVQATLLARHLRGDLPAYAPFVQVC